MLRQFAWGSHSWVGIGALDPPFGEGESYPIVIGGVESVPVYVPGSVHQAPATSVPVVVASASSSVAVSVSAGSSSVPMVNPVCGKSSPVAAPGARSVPVSQAGSVAGSSAVASPVGSRSVPVVVGGVGSAAVNDVKPKSVPIRAGK